MSAPATNIVVQSVIQGPIRIVKGQFTTANNAVNTIDLSQTGPAANVDSGIRTNPNSVVVCSFTTAALGTPVVSGMVPFVNNTGTTETTFGVNFPASPGAGVVVDFIIFG